MAEPEPIDKMLDALLKGKTPEEMFGERGAAEGTHQAIGGGCATRGNDGPFGLREARGRGAQQRQFAQRDDFETRVQ